MKLRAKIERRDDGRTKSLKCTFPSDTVNPFMWERVLVRNLGQRPYGEASMTNADGSRVRIYFKG